jgi:gliding motility-associated-like protein
MQRLAAQCPNVQIESSEQSYCISDFIKLSASGIPTGSTIAWDLGFGWDTATANYSGAAAKSGQLSPKLQVTTSKGEVCNYEETNLLLVYGLPKVQFNVSRTLLCNGLDTVSLYDLTPGTANRTWIINNTTFSNTPDTAIIQLRTTGNQNITLIVDDTNGCRNSLTLNGIIKAYADIELDFEHSNKSHCYPITTNFTSSLSLKGQSIKSYKWTLPGSNTTSANTANVNSVNYANVGNFYAQLEVETYQNCTYRVRKNSFVRLGDKADLNVSVSKSTICLSEPVAIEQTTQPLAGYFSWKTGFDTRRSLTKHKQEMTFRDTGYKNLELVYNHNNCITKKTFNKLLRVQGLKADFDSDNNFHCETPHTVDLENKSDTISATISSYQWRIFKSEDNSLYASSSTKEYSPLISDSGNYDVQLITTATAGCTDTVTKKDFIRINPYLFNFYAEPNIGCVGQEITYVNKTKSASYYGLDLFSWDFFDTDKTTKLGASGSLTPSFTYSDTGRYHTQLTAANPLGCQDIELKENAVWIVNPQLAFEQEDSFFCQTDSLRFVGKSSPIDDRFESNYVFKHDATGKEFSYTGNDVYVQLPELGRYTVKYNYDIESACKDTILGRVYVNGISGSIKLDTQSACSPMIVNPTFEVDYNEINGFTDTTLKYNWEIVPKAGAVIYGASTPNPRVEINQDRTYRVVLYVSNSSGCGFYTRSEPINIGIKAAFAESSRKSCVGDTIFLTNTTTNGPTSISWFCNTNKAYALDSFDFENGYFIAQDTGSYSVSLAVNKSGVCTDTLTKTFETTSLQAQFSMRDTIIGCAPAEAIFINESVNADSLFWFFGDGNSKRVNATDTTYYNYLKNSGTNGYDVQLVAKSNFGCTDTFLREDLIQLLGPFAEFSITNTKGCSPHTVQFTNLSRNYKDFYFTYGDGLPTDTNSLSTFTYENTSTSINQRFSPRIRVVDFGGCEASYELENSVQIYKVPQSHIVFDTDTAICARQPIIIEDTAAFANRYNWEINGSTISKQRKDTISFTEPGFNTLKSTAGNNFGCSTTSFQTFYVKEAVEIDFKMPEFICINQPITVVASVKNETKPLSYDWNFDELGTPGNEQVTTDTSATINYRSPGDKNVVVTAEMPNGCAIPDSVLIRVFDSGEIPTIELDYAGYDSLNNINLKYKNFNFTYFDFFNIYRNDITLKQDVRNAQRILVDSTYDNAMRNCYNLSVTDKCAEEGVRGRAHCPVNLTISNTVPRQVHLFWTYYVGWDRVEKYEIYRRQEDSAFKLVGEVFSTQKEFVDSNDVCNVPYFYRVAAVKEGGNIRSFSNTVNTQPLFEFNPNKPDVSFVTYRDRNTIEITYEPSTYRFNKGYMIERNAERIGNPTANFYTENVSYTDTVPTHRYFPYYYRVFEVDNCDNLSQTGKYKRTIFLDGIHNGEKANLFWEGYDNWEYAPREHHVDYISRQGPLYLGRTDAAITTFSDPSFYMDIDGYYPYRVYTISTSGDTSYSNVAYVSGAGVYNIPNSFTPNNDGLNDVFNFYTLFMTGETINGVPDFEIEIYNRWGQIIFYGTDIDKPWDGTSGDNLQPPGVYKYRIKFTDGNENRKFLGGMIHLIR